MSMGTLGRHRRRLVPPPFTVLAAVFLCCAAVCPGCGPGKTDGHAGILTVAGSTSVQPFAEKLAEEYMAGHPALSINVQGGGSSAGVRAAMSGAAQIGMSSRHLKAEEMRLHQTTIAWDGIAVIVHRSNPITDLPKETVARLFAGEVTRWEELGAPAGGIHFVTREEGSGTRGAFEELIMGQRLISPRALVQDSNGAVREIVAGDPRAIGYISLGLVDQRVKAVSVDGVAPSREEVAAGRYAVVRPFLFLTRGTPEGDAAAFIAFILGARGQEALAAEGLIPVQS
jgi:phosphate transport system substrate-binding protein